MSELKSSDSIWRSFTTERFLSRLRIADASYARNLQEPVRLNAYISYYSTILQDVDHIQQLRQEKLSMQVLALGGDHGKGETVGKQVQQYAVHMRSVVIANSGHWLPEEHPDEIAQHLISLFEE
jgi:pimeloyl-ACP methyl ester carboxylesterase